MVWKTLGIVMIIPTLLISITIAYRTRQIKSELAHNLAISFWISANSFWMISEFFGFDEHPIAWGMEGKHLSIIPFVMGILVLSFYYLFQRNKEEKEMAFENEVMVKNEVEVKKKVITSNDTAVENKVMAEAPTL
jgi:hypothetical protein